MNNPRHFRLAVIPAAVIAVIALITTGCGMITLHKNPREIYFQAGDNWYSLDKRNSRRTLDNIYGRDVTYAGDGRYIAYHDEQIVLFDGDETALFTPKDYQPGCSIYLRDNAVFYAAKDGFRRYDLTTCKDKKLITKKNAYGGEFFYVSEDGKHLYYKSKQGTSAIIYKDLESSRISTLAEGIKYFAVSEDESFIIAERNLNGSCDYCRIDLLTKEETALKVKTHFPSEDIDISPDGSSLLYTTYTEFIVPGMRSCKLHIYDLEKGKDRIIYRSSYFEPFPYHIRWGE